MKPAYNVVLNGTTGLAEVQCEAGILMDNIPGMDVANAVATLANLRHLARDPESGMLYILDKQLHQDMEVETLEEWIDYCRGSDELQGLVMKEPTVTVDYVAPSIPKQKVGV